LVFNVAKDFVFHMVHEETTTINKITKDKVFKKVTKEKNIYFTKEERKKLQKKKF